MLKTLLSLYVAAMAHDVRGVVPHLVGPPGCGKSTVVQQLADMVGVRLHIINVSRLSPLEVEGLQMPTTIDGQARLEMLPAIFWTSLKEGDVLMLDEFLRAEYAAIYNAFLDVLTSRRVGAFELPKVFIVAASNSTIAYDQALSDRLQHIPVPDPRNSVQERKRLATLIVKGVGLLPGMEMSIQAEDLVLSEVVPMFNILDSFTDGKMIVGSEPKQEGKSVRRLISEAQLRYVKTTRLRTLIDANNTRAMSEGKAQYVVLLPNAHVSGYDIDLAQKLLDSGKLEPLQQINTELNLGLLQSEALLQEGSE